ncbi:ABC transporter permease [Aneurinibacillus sp. Ricciae_BoGa-3]|uniref:ABC transporter permease n=1 Tax=Aneurinibacillus sp. Ricciae_BoGa-3 TaxID=3022697 RepID=UPI00233FB594|nr:ABC transporter permease [Aneurinibacillus sp. Ricciae_BoGa-3]WCK52702.1 ABC transporter permease [Aneurinibacillus sp. Ricciae_BoGa-3]
MNLMESVRMSMRSIIANKMRSFLTMLGIIIGVSAVIAMVAIGQGASANVASSINGLGSNLLIVSPGQAQQGGVRMGAGSLDTLTLDDANALASLPTIAAVAPDMTKQGQVIWRNQNYATTIEGTSDSYPAVRNTDVQSGRFMNRFEVEGAANVAVLGPAVVSNLFGDANANPIGETIEINQLPFTVIGVLKTQGSQGAMNQDDRILIPITTAMNRLYDTTKVRTIFASAKDSEGMAKAQFDIEQAIRASHNLNPREDDDFQISSQSDILNAAQSVTGVMTTLLSGIAAISLIVGGIGIMNIMLVSVTERTREIGIRKAIGATRRTILQQFLIESITLSLIGGITGILIGVGAALLINRFTSLTTAISLTPILYSFFSSMLVGIIFGVYPAQKAARLKPIDALRYE